MVIVVLRPGPNRSILTVGYIQYAAVGGYAHLRPSCSLVTGNMEALKRHSRAERASVCFPPGRWEGYTFPLPMLHQRMIQSVRFFLLAVRPTVKTFVRTFVGVIFVDGSSGMGPLCRLS